MAADPPDLVLLDLGLPGEDGFSIARQLREHWHCGLVIVTGRGDAVDKVVGLEVGADDYVTKPFDLRELLARIKAVLRRTARRSRSTPAGAPSGPRALSLRRLGARRRARAGCSIPSGDEVALTSGEFDLLGASSSTMPGACCRATSCSSRRAGARRPPFDRTIDVQVGRLRKKLEADVDDPQIIKSVRGAGYILVAAGERRLRRERRDSPRARPPTPAPHGDGRRRRLPHALRRLPRRAGRRRRERPDRPRQSVRRRPCSATRSRSSSGWTIDALVPDSDPLAPCRVPRGVRARRRARGRWARRPSWSRGARTAARWSSRSPSARCRTTAIRSSSRRSATSAPIRA